MNSIEELQTRLDELDNLIPQAAAESRTAQDRFKDLQRERIEVQAQIIELLKKQKGR